MQIINHSMQKINSSMIAQRSDRWIHAGQHGAIIQHVVTIEFKIELIQLISGSSFIERALISHYIPKAKSKRAPTSFSEGL